VFLHPSICPSALIRNSYICQDIKAPLNLKIGLPTKSINASRKSKMMVEMRKVNVHGKNTHMDA